jgi:DNA-binding IclR family transcriptional regulator
MIDKTPPAAAAVLAPRERKARAARRKTDRPPVTAEELRALIARIEERNHFLMRAELIERLKDEEGLTVTDREGVTVFSMRGLQGESTAGTAIALNNWLMAARVKANELDG